MSGISYKTNLLIGEENVKKLKASCVAVAGLGGVGGFASEALARSMVGSLILIDGDTVSDTNLNRQIYALNSNIGISKAELAQARLSDINPQINITVHKRFINEDNIETFDLIKADYIIDAIDDVNAKIALIKYAKKNNIPIISSMGTGNKLDITRLKICDIYKTESCPLAKIIRKKCKKEGIKDLKVVFSDEIPIVKLEEPASMIFVPASAGLMLACEVVRNLSDMK